MSRNIYVALLATICAGTVLASAQATSSLTETGTSTSLPVAFVYVSSAPTSTTGQINGYAAASNGVLTPIPGSPFRRNVYYMAVNGKRLFGVANQYTDIDSFSIASNGALALKDTYMSRLPGRV